jgi:1-acyl-sn-glycerol-3-phosphate acyltransferase
MRSSEIGHQGPTTSLFLYWVARLWFGLFGWDTDGDPPQFSKGVIIAAPHTTNWDLPHMLAATYLYRLHMSWLGKDTLFRFPMGVLLRWLGGIAIDRSSPQGSVQALADLFGRTDKLAIAIPPEGTRSRREHWKSGFYWVAYTAQVPIVCCYLDYAKKRAGMGLAFVPTGNVREDMDRIRAFYADKRGKFPELESTIVLKEELEAQEPVKTPERHQATEG